MNWITATDGKSYNTKHYSLDAIISAGYRVNSLRATQFRQWATKVLHEFAIKGYVIDRERMDNGSISAALARQYAESEFESYRVTQDRLFESDFDKLVKNSDKDSAE